MSATRKAVAEWGIGPFNIDEHAWYYAEEGGVRVVIELRDKAGGYIGTCQRVMPWADVRNALAIKDHGRRNLQVQRRKAP